MALKKIERQVKTTIFVDRCILNKVLILKFFLNVISNSKAVQWKIFLHPTVNCRL